MLQLHEGLYEEEQPAGAPFQYNCFHFILKIKTNMPVLVSLLSLYPLQPLLPLHTAALSLSGQRLLVLSV